MQVSMLPGAVTMADLEQNLDELKDVELIPYWYQILHFFIFLRLLWISSFTKIVLKSP